MFSLDKFYYILHNNLISEFRNSKSLYFYPHGTYEQKLTLTDSVPHIPGDVLVTCLFVDQEPMYESTIELTRNFVISTTGLLDIPNRVVIIANSEKSNLKDSLIIEKNSTKDWYYFFHGFMCLDWYRDFQYVKQSSFAQFSKVFICYNHLISNYRSYRLHLVSNLIEQDLIQFGAVSLSLQDSEGHWRDTIENPACLLDSRAKVKIANTLSNLDAPLIIDTATPDGTLSANVNFKDLVNAFWHVVTETVYFFPKLHLTEKVFKPIIAQRPFILVAAPGNLAYLRSYGFKTFSHWIDESYDHEPDHYVRIEKITQEIARLCAMSPEQLQQMHQEMQATLQYNYNHFYGEFRSIITNELVDNFGAILAEYNLDTGYLDEVKHRLLQ
jgi:hypothetical protein